MPAGSAHVALDLAVLSVSHAVPPHPPASTLRAGNSFYKSFPDSVVVGNYLFFSKREKARLMKQFARMVEEAKPYRFQFVKDAQPLRVNVSEKRIYMNKEVLMDVIKDLIEAGLDWKEVMKKNLMHEKAHELYQKHAEKWGVGASDYGWLPSFIVDVIIDKVHFGQNEWYPKNASS